MYFLVLVCIFLCGCASVNSSGVSPSAAARARRQTPTSMNPVSQKGSYVTPFGTVHQGASEEEVKKILGNPHRVWRTKTNIFWYYYFARDNRLMLKFDQEGLREVRNQPQGKDDVHPWP
jgi:outer membrane protein assembly factor BamE (lipoprotein component of BamABCDE complex)